MYNGSVYFKDDFKVCANRILKESEKIVLRISTAISFVPPGGGNGNHSSILAWEIPGTEEPSSSCGHKELDMTEQACTSFVPISVTLISSS